MATIALDPRLDKKTSDFIAQKHRMYVDGKFVHLGRYDSEIEAARAYDVFAERMWGEYACLNRA